MSSTDDRIVRMGFDNASFKKGAADTQKSLADLDKAVATAGKGKGLLDLQSGMQRVQVEASKMAVVTTTALATVTSKAVNAGLSLAKSLTFDPIRQGFSEYESLLTKQNVIQNATGKSAKVVKDALNSLNKYSDKTIYSFGNMTDAIQKFVNAGVPLGTSVKTIKGIANAAAFAGASSEEANRAMYAFSQSMSLGFIQLQDWNQIENANMGTIRFKESLLDAGVAAGTLTKRGKEYITASGTAISATKGWRDGLQEQWATTKVLNSALATYADRSTKLGRKAFAAAQEVRTFSAFMDTLKESLGSGWSQIFTALIGNLNQSTKMWTGLSNAVGGVVKDFFNWATTALTVWRQMGGFNKTLEGFKNILAPIGAILDVIGTAFRAAFPSSDKGAGKALYGLSAGFAAITKPLQLVADLIRLLTKPLTVFFQLLHIGGVAIGDVVGFVVDFVKSIAGLVDLKAPSSGGFLGWIKDLGSEIARVVGKISTLLSKGKSLGDAFGSVHFNMPDLPNMPDLGSIGSIFSGGADKTGAGLTAGAAGATTGIGKMTGPLKGLGVVMKVVSGGFKEFSDSANAAGDDVSSAGKTMGNVFEKLWDAVSKFFDGVSFEDIVSSFNIAVLSTFMISVSRFMNTLTGAFKGFVGTGESVNRVLGATTNALNSFQTQARAKLILNIAIAIGILAASLWLLSKIPMKNLAVALLAMAGVFRLLDTAMKSLTRLVSAMDKSGMSVKMLALSVAITALGFSMILLATAMLIFNKVDIMSVIKGLATMFVTLKLIEGLGNAGKYAAKNMIAGAFAITAIAGAMLLLATALLAFKLVDWESMGKAGLVLLVVAAAVGLLALLPAPALLAVGAALLSTSLGMVAMATALVLFSGVKWESIGKLAVVLGALAIALGVMMALGGPVAVSGMIGLGLGMLAIATAGLILNKVNWSSIGKIAVILGVLVVAAAAFAAILAAFLWIVAPIAPVLIILAAAFALLGVGLLAFSAALALAMSLAAAGTAAFAALATGAAVAIGVFMQTLAAEAPILKDAFLDMLQTLIDTIVEAVPMIIDGIKRLWTAVIEELGGADKKEGTKQAGGAAIGGFADGIKEKSSKIFKIAIDILLGFLNALRSRAGELASAGADLIVKLLEGLSRKAGEMAVAAIGLIVEFAKGIGKGLSKIVNAGIDLIAQFLHDLADAIRNGSSKIGGGLADVANAFFDVGVNIVEAIGRGLMSLASKPKEWIEDIVGELPGWAKKLLHISSPSKVFMEIGKFLVLGLTEGIQNNAAAAITAVASMVSGQIAVANEYVNEFIQRLDQQALSARAKADGLAAAAKTAAAAAKKTATKSDDKAAKKLDEKAKKAAKVALAAEKKSDAAKIREDREEEFRTASLLDKAKMKSEDAQKELDAAKAAEARAEKERVEAAALDKASRAKGLTAAERKRLRKEADELRAKAKKDALSSNKHLENAKKAAGEALDWQKKAGEEAAAAFQAAFDEDARKANEEAEFEKLSASEKAELRKKQADEMQAKALADLAEAKRLAFTDIDAANELAKKAQEEAAQARQYLDDVAQFSGSSATGGNAAQLGTVVNLEPTDAAAIAMNDYANLYSRTAAAAAGTRSVEFNQYNTSPEALSAVEIYRQSNNLFAYAVEKLDNAA